MLYLIVQELPNMDEVWGGDFQIPMAQGEVMDSEEEMAAVQSNGRGIVHGKDKHNGAKPCNMRW